MDDSVCVVAASAGMCVFSVVTRVGFEEAGHSGSEGLLFFLFNNNKQTTINYTQVLLNSEWLVITLPFLNQCPPSSFISIGCLIWRLATA